MLHPIWRTDVEEASHKPVLGVALYLAFSTEKDDFFGIRSAAGPGTESARVAATLVHTHAKALSGAVSQQPADFYRLENALEAAYVADLFLTCQYMPQSPTGSVSSRIPCFWHEMSSDPLEALVCFPKESARKTDAWRPIVPRRPDDPFQLLAEHLRKLWRFRDRISLPKPPTKSFLLPYEVRHSVEVEDFLGKHQELPSVLRDAPVHIREEGCFPGAKLALDVFMDPDGGEEEAGSEYQLVIVIKTELPAEEAFNRFERLQESWWLERFVKYGDRLGLDLEFV